MVMMTYDDADFYCDNDDEDDKDSYDEDDHDDIFSPTRYHENDFNIDEISAKVSMSDTEEVWDGMLEDVSLEDEYNKKSNDDDNDSLEEEYKNDNFLIQSPIESHDRGIEYNQGVRLEIEDVTPMNECIPTTDAA